MNYTISNANLTVTIASLGAELQSIKGNDGTEYLWQGDVESWGSKAINIFPYVARLTEGKYTFQGETYHMGIHGFLWSSELEVEEHTKNAISFVLNPNEETRKQYPFEFSLHIRYELDEKGRISITFEVENKDDKTIHFGLGGHPGFQVPNEPGFSFEDYYLEFRDSMNPRRVGISKACFVLEEDTDFPLRENRFLDLRQDLFVDDAIVLKNMSKQVTLRAKGSTKWLTVTYEDMNYLGIWNWPTKDVPYICIEPWLSLPSRQGIVEDFETQRDLISLPTKQSYQNKWSIEIGN